MRLLRTFFLFALILLSGCASTTPKYPGLVEPSAGKAVVYIYRVDLLAGVDDIAPNVRINFENIGALTRNGYFRVEANPGSAQLALYKLDIGDNVFWPANKDIIVNLDMEPDNTYFVELSLNTTTISFGTTSREVALEAMPGKNLLN